MTKEPQTCYCHRHVVQSHLLPLIDIHYDESMASETPRTYCPDPVSSALSVSHGALPCIIQHTNRAEEAQGHAMTHQSPVDPHCGPVPGSAMHRPNHHLPTM